MIQIWGLKLDLGGRPVLREVNLSLQPGTIYGLLGPNGAGKSTTLSVVTGLRKAKSGSVRVLGMDPAVEGRALRGRIGVLPEQAGFYDWMTAREYLDWSARLYGKRKDPGQVASLLQKVGLEVRDHAGIATYSRGMRQRLALARALIHDPELLILDEPTNGLDPRGRREIHDVLLALSQQDGVGILLCTHLLDDVDRLCSRIGILTEGQTMLEGSITDLLARRPASFRFRLRVKPSSLTVEPPPGVRVIMRTGEWWLVEVAPDMPVSTAWQGLLNAGLLITEIHEEGGGLEDLYLTATTPLESVS